MDSSLKMLEFNKIKENIERYTYSSSASFSILNLKPSTNYEEVIENAKLTNDLLNLITKYGKLPFLKDFDNIVIKNENFLPRVYYIEEFLFLRLFLNMERNINDYFLKNNSLLIKDFKDHSFILTELNKVFSDNSEIFDDASIELKRVRTKIKSLEFDLNNKLNSLLKKYESFLSEQQLVIRNNRYCLGVKETYKNKVSGILHDISNSGQTIFIEPEISLTYHNLINIEKDLEKKEIEKILIKLTTLINDNYDSLHNSLNALINLDIISAKALYSKEIDGILPNINNLGILELINAKHPLIDKKIVVPISLKLDNDKKTLLITGPNTGGKTVSLKTTGLLTVMIQSGILIPVSHNSNIQVFDNVFVDIGDEQSILNSLSTFSSHMSKIINYLNNLTNNSLVLLDELGSGTDPLEGVSIAIAIIEEFLKKDIRLIVTSHFSELKTYALEHSNIITASVAFDENTLKPLYYLKHGLVGKSHARLIAKRLGISDNVIKKADEIFSNKESDTAKLLKKLDLELEETYLLKEKYEASIYKYQEESKALELEREKLIKEQITSLEQIKLKQDKILAEKIAEIDLMLERLKTDSNIKLHDVTKLKRLKNEKLDNVKIKEKSDLIKTGDTVFIKSYGQHGTVYNIKNDIYYVKFGIFDLGFKLEDLKLVKPEIKPKEKIKRVEKNQVSHDFDTSSKLSVDLRGLRYEEVSDKLDKAIDKALLSNIKSLTIIHGFGTFAVKKAVDEYLRKSSLIKSKRSGKEGEGLGGVTVITFK